MRASIEKDRQIDGVWTAYIAPLERSVLKKRRYLEPPAAPDPVASNHGSQAGNGSPAEASNASASPATKPSAPRPASSSPFASKLQEALHHEK
jgi:hypothetical protein